MDDFPANSDRSKEEPKATTEKIEELDKRITKVVEGQVVRRKKSIGRRFKDVFIGGSASTVGEYILYDILIPAIKDTIADVTTQGVERMLFAEVRSTSRRISNRRGPRDNYANYTDYTRRSQHRPPWENDRRSDPRRDRRKPPGRYDFDEIIISTRAEAEKVIDTLFDIISKYESASVADLYEMLGVSGSYMDNKWGWYDIRGSDLVVRTARGYLLNLPDPEPLN